jgi:hypothetical protein
MILSLSLFFSSTAHSESPCYWRFGKRVCHVEEKVSESTQPPPSTSKKVKRAGYVYHYEPPHKNRVSINVVNNKEVLEPIPHLPQVEDKIDLTTQQTMGGANNLRHVSQAVVACGEYEKKLRESEGGEVHLTYAHIHGHIDHYYHFVHDSMLTFYRLYMKFMTTSSPSSASSSSSSSSSERSVAPSLLSKVYLWNSASYGTFTNIFETIYNVKVETVPCKCPEGLCTVMTTDTSPAGSANLDSEGVLAGVYPTYFNAAIEFIQKKVMIDDVFHMKSRIVNQQQVGKEEQEQEQEQQDAGEGEKDEEGVPALSQTTISLDYDKNSTTTIIGIDEQPLLDKAHRLSTTTINTINTTTTIVLIERRSHIPSNLLSRKQKKADQQHNNRRLRSKEETVAVAAAAAPNRNVGILNHEELKASLIEKFGQERVLNVMLEDMSFAEQVHQYLYVEYNQLFHDNIYAICTQRHNICTILYLSYSYVHINSPTIVTTAQNTF